MRLKIKRKFISLSNLQQVLTETRLENVDLSKSYASTLSIWPKEIQAQTEEWTTQTAIYCDTFWLQSFGTPNSSLANSKFLCVTVQFLLCFILNRRAVSGYKPPGAFIWRGPFIGGFFCVTSLGGLYLEGLIHGWAYFRTFTVLAFITVTIKELLETD